MKYKVGDKVTVIKKDAYTRTGSCEYMNKSCKGIKAEIKQVDPNSYVLYECDKDGYIGWFEEDEVKLTEEQPMKGEMGRVGGIPVFETQTVNKFNIISKTMSEVINTLKKVPSQLKRVMNKDLQAQYKVGFRNGDLALTTKGREALLEVLALEKEKELANVAREEIEEVENK